MAKFADSNGYLYILVFNFTFPRRERKRTRRKDMGELLPKGQPAVELAANQRLVALVHRAQSEQPSDRNQRATTLTDSQTTAR